MADGSVSKHDAALLLAELGTPKCPHCGECKPYHITTRDRFKCRETGRQFSRKTGLQNYRCSKLPFKTLQAIEADFAAGLYAQQVADKHGVNYRTAWRLRKVFKATASGWGWNKKERPPKTPPYRPYSQSYPYGRKQNDLVTAVDLLMPRYRDVDLRADLCQEILLIALAHKMTATDIAEGFKVLLSRAWKAVVDPLRAISIYTPVFAGSSQTIIDRVDTEYQYLRIH